MKRIFNLTIGAGMALILMLLGGCGASQSSSSDADRYLDPSDALVPRETGAVGHLELSDLDRAGFVSFEEYVATHTTGVDIDEFGNLVIRGRSTEKGFNKPLILFDGIEVHDTSTIDPFDIATIDVIKDGTSSIYGMRGNGGVIVVTSKAKAAARSDKKSDKKKKNTRVEINSSVSTTLK